jgi:hypothetical protein
MKYWLFVLSMVMAAPVPVMAGERLNHEQLNVYAGAFDIFRDAEDGTNNSIDALIGLEYRSNYMVGKLYGSVAARDIEVALAEAGHKVERRFIDLTTAIKSLGVYEAIVNLHPEVHVKVKVQVARNAEGLLAQELSAKADAKAQSDAAMFDEPEADTAEDESAA